MTKPGRKPIASEIRFEKFIAYEPNTGCWLWLGARSGGNNGKNEYGIFDSEYAHRFSYKLYKGNIPEKFQIDHLCKNKLCVNPDHLEAVTHKVNTLRAGSVSAINSRKTHCHKGHIFDEKNTWLEYKNGKKIARHCRKCHAANESVKRLKKKEKAQMGN